MSHVNQARRRFLSALALGGAACLTAKAWAEDKEGVQHPVFRIARAENLIQKPGEHPLDPALRLATEALVHVQRDIVDYTCTIIKRERIAGVLNEYEYMEAKIRNRKTNGDQIATPLSVYLSFVKPDSVKGREVIYVETQNNGKLIAHEGGLLGRVTVALDPNGKLAMRGNLYPITEIGIENLVAKLIERGSRDKGFDPTGKETTVEFKKGAKINKRSCLMLTVKHTVQRPQYEFEVAQVFLDDEFGIPVRYVAYGWPERPGDAQPVLEEYTYVNVKLNVGLADADFDPANNAYRFGKILGEGDRRVGN